MKKGLASSRRQIVGPEEKARSCRFRLDIRRNFFSRWWSGTGMAAQGGGGVAVPGSVQEASGRGAARYGLVYGSSGNGRTVGLNDLVGPC